MTNEIQGSLQQPPDKHRGRSSALPKKRWELLLKYHIHERGIICMWLSWELEAAYVYVIIFLLPATCRGYQKQITARYNQAWATCKVCCCLSAPLICGKAGSRCSLEECWFDKLFVVSYKGTSPMLGSLNLFIQAWHSLTYQKTYILVWNQKCSAALKSNQLENPICMCCQKNSVPREPYQITLFSFCPCSWTRNRLCMTCYTHRSFMNMRKALVGLKNSQPIHLVFCYQK